nr:MAG TPA: hypothetical protein [Caudoviricetes sp.]
MKNHVPLPEESSCSLQGSGPKETASYLRVRCLSFVQYARTVSEIPSVVSEVVLAFLYKMNKKGGKPEWRETLHQPPA